MYVCMYVYYQQSLNSEHIKRYTLQSNVSPISAREAIMLNFASSLAVVSKTKNTVPFAEVILI